jgi:hypothetical protein
MPQFRLKFEGGEFLVRDGVTTIGRVTDNDVSFPEDSNVSRYHAEIESVGIDYRLIDLGSSNGTTVNGKPVKSSAFLSHGDVILLGGSSRIVVESAGVAATDAVPASSGVPAGSSSFSGGSGSSGFAGGGSASPPGFLPAGTAATEPAAAAGTAEASGGFSGLLIAGAVVGCLVVLFTVGAVAYYVTRKPACEAKARIIKPETGDTLSQSTDIEIDVDNSSCVGKAVFLIDGVEFASAEEPPYDASIDPKEFPDLADGGDHSLSVMLQDEKGEVINQPTPVLLAFETREIAKPVTGNKEVIAESTQPKQSGPAAKAVTLIEVQNMSKRLLKEFSGNFSYNVSDKQFLQEVLKRTPEYAQEGYFDRAARYRDAINVAYAREQNVDASLGFILAMSRSKFDPTKQGENEGLWRLSNAFITAGGYNGICGTETLSDASQGCAAKSSAIYMKQIVFTVFEGDPVYSAVAFGKSPQEASAWKATLPANRANLWSVIKTPQEREQLVRFFAAGIVAENPQSFGLKKDRSLSELYKLTL